MFARIPLLLLLIVSLLSAGMATPAVREVLRRDAGGACAQVCLKQCCTSKACCESSQQQQTPQPAAPLAPRPEFQLAALSFQVFSLVYGRPPGTVSFIRTDERSAPHSRPPLAQSCIQLI